MALIKCNECGGHVSDTASTCPHCGNRIDVNECVAQGKIDSINKKNKIKDIAVKVVIAIGLFWLLFCFLIPKIFFRGKANWTKYYRVTENVSEYPYEKYWDIEPKSDEYTYRVTIHFIHTDDKGKKYRTTMLCESLLYGDTIYESEVKRQMAEKVPDMTYEQIDALETDIEYISWD